VTIKDGHICSIVAGVEFTNGDQPGVRLASTVAARSPEASSKSKPGAGRKQAAKLPRRQRRNDDLSIKALWSRGAPRSKRLHKLFKGRVGTTAYQSFIGSDEK
jgi:hypothetical protein